MSQLAQGHRHLDGASIRDLLPLATAISALERAGHERDREMVEVKTDVRTLARDLGAQISSSYGALRAELHQQIAESEKRQIDTLKEVEGRLSSTLASAVQTAAAAPSREQRLMELVKLALLLCAALVIGSEGVTKLLGG